MQRFSGGDSNAVYDTGTSDEIYCYDPETKTQSAQWVFLFEEILLNRNVGKKILASFYEMTGHYATTVLEDKKKKQPLQAGGCVQAGYVSCLTVEKNILAGFQCAVSLNAGAVHAQGKKTHKGPSPLEQRMDAPCNRGAHGAPRRVNGRPGRRLGIGYTRRPQRHLNAQALGLAGRAM
ncbi:hypothetical protein EVAR_34053_1 [Eumeta japonica]|uniref:Uncharacterized protein n=1 Tax=Eumeta variegata TaxID=151549 RepID=A0A4C1VSX7_EUMVA|nr:hypothetical protein EVAR_34053_1 [Eumeta japonica]